MKIDGETVQFRKLSEIKEQVPTCYRCARDLGISDKTLASFGIFPFAKEPHILTKGGGMKTVKVLFANSDSITTDINGTDEEIKDYYKIGRVFNLGDGSGGDLLSKVIGLLFLEEKEKI